MAKNLRFLLLILVFLIPFSQKVSADQCALFTKSRALEVVEFLESRTHLVLFCGCCDGDQKEYMSLTRAFALDGRWGEGAFEVIVEGTDHRGKFMERSIDLAYTHYIKDGKAFCVGTEFAWCAPDPCTEPFNFEIPSVQVVETFGNAESIELNPDFQFSKSQTLDFALNNLSPSRTLKASQRWASCLGFTREGKRLITGGGYFEEKSDLLGFHLQQDGEPWFRFMGLQEQIQSLAVSPTENIFAASDGTGQVIIYDYLLMKKRCSMREHSDWIEGMTFSKDGKYLATASRDGKVLVHETDFGTIIREYEPGFPGFASVEFSPDNQYLVCGGYGIGEEILVFDLNTNAELFRADLFKKDRVMDLEILPNGWIAAAGDCDNEVIIFDYLNNRMVNRIESPGGCVVALDADPSGHYLAVAANWKVFVIDLRDFTLKFEAKSHSYPVEDVQFSPSGKTVASAGRDGEIHFWDFK